jgi:type VI protein secretion system component VasF
MREQLLNLVNPVLRTGLRLRDDWSRGVGMPFDAGRELLIQTFRNLFAAFPIPSASSRGTESTTGDLLQGAGEASIETRYLGVGYALVSWVDELFTLNSPVGTRWNERKFEAEFYSTNDRAWRFWEQARLAADRPGDDELEVFYLCAALGFRGEWVEDPTRLRAWLGATRERLVKGLRQDWVGPPALDPPSRVPPRYGKARLRRMAIVAGLSGLLCIPAAVVLIARLLAR